MRSHLVADVPLGVFLSSGMDSTAIVALASREQQDLHTFTVAFSEKPFSEASLARKTAERFQTRHDELLLTGEEMLARWEKRSPRSTNRQWTGSTLTLFPGRRARWG